MSFPRAQWKHPRPTNEDHRACYERDIENMDRLVRELRKDHRPLDAILQDRPPKYDRWYSHRWDLVAGLIYGSAGYARDRQRAVLSLSKDEIIAAAEDHKAGRMTALNG